MMAPFKYRPDIDGLRAVAVTGVILFHSGLPQTTGLPLRGGYLGVDVFFVISGFLITRILLEDGEKNISDSIVSFYQRRIRRIVPAALVMMLVSACVGTYYLIPDDLIELSNSMAASVTFVANVYFYYTSGYFSEASENIPMLHMWSLAVEEQFYLAVPLALLMVRSRPRILLVGTVSLLAVSSVLALVVQDRNASFYLLPTRTWQLLAGSVIALGVWRGWLPTAGRLPIAAIGIGAIVCGFVFADESQAYGAWTFAVVAGAAIVVAFGGGNDWGSRALRSRPLVGVGLASYSLYLWHQPIFAFSRVISLRPLSLADILFLIGITGVNGTLSYFFVELPFRRRKITIIVAVVLSVPAAVLIVFWATAHIERGFPSRFTSDVRALLESQVERGTAAVNGRSCSNRPIGDSCVLGKSGVRPTVALVGDSHAETLMRPMAEMLESLGQSMLVMTKPSCPFIGDVEPTDGSAQCAQFVDAVLREIEVNGLDRVVIQDRAIGYITGVRYDNGEGGVEPGTGFPVEPVGFRGVEHERVVQVLGLQQATLQRLLDGGVQVYYVTPVPEAGWHVPRAVVKAAIQHKLPLTTSFSRYQDRIAPLRAVLDRVARAQNFHLVDSASVICDQATSRCATHGDGRIYYTDTDHLSLFGAQLVTEVIRRAISDEAARPTRK